MNYFKPTYEFEHFTDMNIAFLEEKKIKVIFSDLDSTLASHDQLGDHQFTKWYEKLKKNGTELVIVSNNSQGRVDRFTKPYNIKGYGKCNKPAIKKIESIRKSLNVPKENCVFLGDQIFTDVVCGKRLGVATVLVKPVGEEHEPWNIKLKRKIEMIIKKRW